jgi:hypothetical protein
LCNYIIYEFHLWVYEYYDVWLKTVSIKLYHNGMIENLNMCLAIRTKTMHGFIDIRGKPLFINVGICIRKVC